MPGILNMILIPEPVECRDLLYDIEPRSDRMPGILCMIFSPEAVDIEPQSYRIPAILCMILSPEAIEYRLFYV